MDATSIDGDATTNVQNIVLWDSTSQAILLPNDPNCSPRHLSQRGSKQISNPNTLFHDLNQLLQHPMFQDFSLKYFQTWSSTQLIVRMCQMYIELDQLSPRITNPYAKLALLRDTIGEHDYSSSNDQLTVQGQLVYQTEPMLKDVADIMEYETTCQFIQKYFLDWDTGDLVAVLIQLYQCLDRRVTWSPEQKIGFLHYVLENKATRQTLAQKINDWKQDSGHLGTPTSPPTIN